MQQQKHRIAVVLRETTPAVGLHLETLVLKTRPAGFTNLVICRRPLGPLQESAILGLQKEIMVYRPYFVS